MLTDLDVRISVDGGWHPSHLDVFDPRTKQSRIILFRHNRDCSLSTNLTLTDDKQVRPYGTHLTRPLSLSLLLPAALYAFKNRRGKKLRFFDRQLHISNMQTELWMLQFLTLTINFSTFKCKILSPKSCISLIIAHFRKKIFPRKKRTFDRLKLSFFCFLPQCR